MSYKGSRMTGTSRVFPCPDPDAPPVIPTKIFSSSTIVEKMMLNCSGCSTLQDIVHLDLSNRRISTLDPAVFSRMSSLVDLNLTNNRLTGFPLSLGLRHLKKLNCNSNLLKSVHTLEQFPSVEELHIENNELTVADQYIAVYMLPKLKVLNGKEVDLRETILNMEETLQEQVHILWAESCAPLLKDPMSRAEVQMLEQQFIELLKNQVQFGPDALTDFTHHMLTVLAEKCVRQMTAHLRKIAEPGTPISKVQIVVRNETGGSASKAISNGSAAALAKSVEKRQNQAQSSEQEPAQKKAKAVQGGATPKGKVPKTSAKKKMIEAQKRQEAGVVDADDDTKPEVKEEEEVDDEDEEMESQDSNQECGIAYEPVHLLRCHSVDNDPTDCKTNVWKCAFEPNPEIDGASKWTVATCGSNQVCVIDCNSGKVLKKYQHTREKEEFYCIAWTKLSVITEQQRRPTTVLAAGGVRGTIKLLHTTQLLCYAEIKCEKKGKPVNCLLFHPKRPTWLFCGSEDITVIDIGIPQGADLKTRHKKLFTLEAPGRCLGLVICPKSNFLMAGCDNGCYGWDIDVKGPMSKREKSHNVEFLLPSKARLMGDEEEEMEDDSEKEGDMIDGLALLRNDLIASKVACDGAIHVWSLSKSRKRQVPGSKEVTINPHYTLEWCDSDSVYLDIGTWPGCGVLVSGDDQGEVWVYDVSKKWNTKIKKPVKPSQLLPWPENNEQEMEEEEEPKVKEISDQEAEAILKQREAEEAAGKQQEEEVKTEEKAQEQSSDATVEKQETAESAVAQVLEEVVTQVVGNDEREEAVVVQEPADQQKGETPVDGQEVNAETAKEAAEAAPKDTNEGEVAEEKAKEEEVADSSKAAESEQEKTEEADKAEAKENDQDAKVEEVEEKVGNEAAEPQKRGRGRPRKYVSSEAPKEKPPSTPSGTPSTPSGTPRGRGRPRKTSITNDDKDSEKQRDQTPRAAAPGSAAQTARARREAKIQEAAKKAKLAQIKAEKKLEEKARKKAEAEQAKAEKAKLKAENAKARAEIAELRQSLKKSKGAEELILADSEDRIIVNDVAISSDCKFIVSVTNKNLICVWQRV
ncbi:leucine-rich repeat and WD repeat-containing protein 1-like [Lytechinus variegatus]|uniref:leucine-rich repeat and WD repeat-containing protein 1-like n=1 Tax=Lytechinus variegatus TaxID=7654 RepID=UPI001BB15789|nr:leucine-rich repeat and WD repeat-containing protein 1-like [Lytechinus variegatus]